MDSTVRDILKSILVAETLNHWVDDRYVEKVSMTSILPKVSVSSSDIIEYPDYNNIINKANDWDDDPYDMFDDTFEDLINSNAFTIKGYFMDKYVLQHLDVVQDETKLNIKCQLDVLKFIDHRTK